MGLSPGARFGPYEIVALLGAGGMGEVYRARDARLAREVAVKVLPASVATDADMLRRFEQEARAAGGLNHPNILAIFDVGAQEGVPYVVSELLEGETLRERLAEGPLSQRKAIDYTLQIAQGLAAAHEKGIVHRDLKPENLFVTRDERIKILDFGLAKLARPTPTADEATGSLQLEASGTHPGTVLGTVGYMSPEQVRAKPVDHRSDIFSFGAVLYEMLAAQRAFRGDSAIEVLNAVLKDDPPDLSQGDRALSPALDRIVRRCLEKRPEQRFQSIMDVAFALEAISGLTSASATAAPLLVPARRRVGLWPALGGAAVVLAAVAMGVLLGKRANPAPVSPTFHRLTFQRGMVLAARFAPDGQTIVYSAAWEGAPPRIFSARLGSPESRSLGLPDAGLASLSSTGEMAILLGSQRDDLSRGTLARVPLAGGAPREVVEGVIAADWSPDGAELAVIREQGGQYVLEFPVGKTLYEVKHNVSYPRVSPKGDLVAFLEFPDDLQRSVCVIDRAGKKTTLSRGWVGAMGLAWSPTGEEVWFAATDGRSALAIRAVDLSGRQRVVLRTPGKPGLFDIAKDGRVLLKEAFESFGMPCLPPGQSKELDLAWMDGSKPADLSDDGRTVLFSERRWVGGSTNAVYLRRTDGSAAVRLGEGEALALSPDGKAALAMLHSSPPALVLLPTGAGESLHLEGGGIVSYLDARFFPDGKRVLLVAHTPSHGQRLYVQDLSGGPPQAFGPEGVSGGARISPDGQLVAVPGPDGIVLVCPVGGNEAKPIKGLAPGDVVVRWSGDGRSLFVYNPKELLARVFRLDLASGRKQLWKEIAPDPAGVTAIEPILMTSDGTSYVYGVWREPSNLFLVEGLK